MTLFTLKEPYRQALGDKLLLGVRGDPLAPVHFSSSDLLPRLSIKGTPIETSSVQYIHQQYTAAFGGRKLQNSIKKCLCYGEAQDDHF
ncbi:unnamed protein product [Brassica oleracea var. botrytis]|uniref:(rape) hypothetical protein n=1 Tax=Brassica napus TaxID=3708 RepID=A0A816LPW1_BRANA|nr:unnamed protein product [Brassica napus]